MQSKRIFTMMIVVGTLLVFATGIWLAAAQPVSAQCGSQASSCKNCHEVQGQKAVNSDGTGWHQSHAFGDFCYLCHAGNNQASDKDTAHTGMVPPLSDVKAACSACHVQDYMERAKVYADKLGIQLGGEAASTGNATAEATKAAPAVGGETPSAPVKPTVAQPAPGEAAATGNQPVIDYVEQYNESVLGKTPINWGNIIVGVLIVMIVVLGGAFVYFNERKFRGILIPKMEKAGAEVMPINPSEYPAEIVALLPQINALNPVGRKALARLLANPDAASDLLLTLSRIDLESHIRRMKNLDREAQALLIALTGN